MGTLMAPVMIRAWYHIVVVGTDLAGLIFAALTARRGYRVCVLGQGMSPSRYRVDGLSLLRAGEVFSGVSVSPAIRQVFTELALGLELKNRPQPVEPTLQLVMPGVRLDFAKEGRVFERELEREFPGQADGIAALDAEAREASDALDQLWRGELPLPPLGLMERLALRRALRGVDPRLLDEAGAPFRTTFANPRLVRAAAAIVDHLGGFGAEQLPLHLVMRIWRAFRDGIYRVPEGADGLAAMFVRKLQDQSGDYRPEALATSLEVKRSRVTAVHLAERGETLGCELLVLNAPPDRVGPLVGAPSPAPRAHRATVNVAVDPRVIPPAMGPELLVLNDGVTPAGAPALPGGWWISRPGVGPLSGAEGRPGPGIVQMSCTIRRHQTQRLLEEPALLRRAALETLREVIPWLDDGLRAVDIPPPLAMTHGPDPRGASAVASPWGPLPLSNTLATGGAGVTPLGLEGACQSALIHLHRLKRHIRLKGGLPHGRA